MDNFWKMGIFVRKKHRFELSTGIWDPPLFIMGFFEAKVKKCEICQCFRGLTISGKCATIKTCEKLKMWYWSPEEDKIRIESLKKQRSIQGKKYRQKLKVEVLTHYGNGKLACVCCGERRVEFLTLDHYTASSKFFYRNKGGNFYARVKRYGYPEGIQTFCYNCNMGKRSGEKCPHEPT